MLNDEEIVPYLLEFREVADAAHWHIDQLREAAAAWVRDRRRSDAAARPTPVGQQEAEVALGQAIGRQTAAFDAVDGFLMNWARASFLVYPVSEKDPYTKARGETMRAKLKLTDDTLDDRDVRDSWVHFDERLDRVSAGSQLLSRHMFALAKDVTPPKIAGTLRLLEMDTLVLHYHLRDGRPASANLWNLWLALNYAHLSANVAWSELQLPVPAP
jgi:hypothetical protein